jgi:lipopolysaccharide export system protein LptA
MIKTALLLIFFAIFLGYGDENKDPLILKHADGFEYINRGGVRIQRLTGHVSILYKGLDIKADTVLNDAAAGKLEFFNKVTLVDTTDRFLKTNRLVYFKNDNTADARGAIEVIDTSDRLRLTGDEGRYTREGRVTKVTKNPVLLKVDTSGSDTLKIISRIMEHFGNLKKSTALHNVVIRQRDMRAFCERSEYMHKEGIITLFENPVVEYDGDKITGDTIHLYMENDNVKEFKAVGHANARFSDSASTTLMTADTILAYLTNREVRRADLYGQAKTVNYNGTDSTKHNTLNAKRISFFIENGAIDSMHAFDNASATYVYDEKGGDNGRNETSGDTLFFHFRAKKIDRIHARGAIRGVYFSR